jgi:Nif-specific regulatory protein
MQEVQRQIEKVAPTRATVLLLGESGTGKTLIGRIIHDLSDRTGFPFIKVNCASIPENLLESELFGYEKGAFTGADSTKPGRFEDAHKGTIFLDEIGELPLGLQAKLLRVLQDREFERLGSNKTRRVDVRILAATNKDLGALAEAGAFRPDLYYRLNVFPLRVPPLRDRKEDIQSLLIHFLTKVSKEYSRTLSFSTQALSMLTRYDWPGNVREMENLVERLVILAEDEHIGTDLILPYLSGTVREPGPELTAELESGPSLENMEKTVVIEALRRAGGIQHRAARELGITPRQMGYRVKKFGLEAMVAVQRAKGRE